MIRGRARTLGLVESHRPAGLNRGQAQGRLRPTTSHSVQYGSRRSGSLASAGTLRRKAEGARLVFRLPFGLSAVARAPRDSDWVPPRTNQQHILVPPAADTTPSSLSGHVHGRSGGGACHEHDRQRVDRRRPRSSEAMSEAHPPAVPAGVGKEDSSRLHATVSSSTGLERQEIWSGSKRCGELASMPTTALLRSRCRRTRLVVCSRRRVKGGRSRGEKQVRRWPVIQASRHRPACVRVMRSHSCDPMCAPI